MKYKSRQTHQEVAEIFIESCKAHIPDWQKYFKPVYEEGDDVVLIDKKGCDGSLKEGRVYKIAKISYDGEYIYLLGGRGYFPHRFRPATSEEIEQATKKLPFEYTIEIYGSTMIVRECNTVSPNRIAIENKNKTRLDAPVYLTEEAWREIGNRKGWDK